MGQGLNDWCDEDNDSSIQQEEKAPMVLPEVSVTPSSVNAVVATQAESDVIDLSRLFEEYDAAVKDYGDLLKLREQIKSSGTMNRAIALEALAVYPGFDKQFHVKAFTTENSGVGMEAALNNLDKGIAALIGAAIGAIGVIIWKLIRAFKGKKKSEDGKIDKDIHSIPSSAEAIRENEDKADEITSSAEAIEDALEELVDTLSEVQSKISEVGIGSLNDLDTAFNSYLRVISPDKDLSAFVPVTAIGASVKYAKTFHKDLVRVYSGSLAAAEEAMKKLNAADSALERLSRNPTDEERSNIKSLFADARADVVIDGKNIKDQVSSLKETAKSLVEQFKTDAAKSGKLSVLLKTFYSYGIAAQLTAVNALSENNDRVIAILHECDEIYESIKAKSAAVKHDESLGSYVLAYTGTVKNVITALRDGAMFAHSVRDEWVNKTPGILVAVEDFVTYLTKIETLQSDTKALSALRKIKKDLHSSRSAIAKKGL